ncbi:uncharacterized protein LOC112436418 [Xyrichtys novacula]|uniref:Uncharacterized protein LOC112436418 n=1 Tax=Xyrichtys novacula TaxID=13765 RepID=A0AAV1G1Y5_XYRNO|nr:uncharacterized protein LOC112436418 [Xyrichtys novacula]
MDGEEENGASGGVDSTEGQGQETTLSDLVSLFGPTCGSRRPDRRRKMPSKNSASEHSNTSSNFCSWECMKSLNPCKESQNNQTLSLWKLMQLHKLLPLVRL